MRKFLLIVAAIILIFGLAACTTGNKEPEKTEKQQEITLYFANKSYVQTGDEKLEKVLPEKRTITLNDVPLEEAVVRELLAGTKQEELQSGIPESVRLLDVKVAEGTAYVNFAQEGLAGGSLQESLTIAQITRSLRGLEGIKNVQFLIDGKKAESLMGHIDTTNPFES